MSSSKKTRRHYTTEQEVAILKRHMVDKVPVSDLCNELELPAERVLPVAAPGVREPGGGA